MTGPRRLLLLSLTACLLAIAPATDAGATHHRIYYSYDKGDCNPRAGVDPVTVIWLGTHATARRVSDHLVYHHWGSNTEGGTQWVHSDGGCHPMGAQRANGGGGDARFHVRLWDTRERDHDGNRFVAGTPHFEWRPSCGHAVNWYNTTGAADGASSGFNLGRRRMGDLFKYGPHHHRTSVANWRNSYVFRQCGRDRVGDRYYNRYAASNGYVTIIHVGWVR